MDAICRICLKKDENNSFLVFLNNCHGLLTIYDCYKLLTSINLEDQAERDKSMVCQECLSNLFSFHDFRCLAIKNNEYLINSKKSLALDIEELDDVKDEINNLIEYQEAEELDTFCLSSVKVEYLEDVSNQCQESSATIKEEVRELNDPVEPENRKYPLILDPEPKPKRIKSKNFKTETFACIHFDCAEVFKNKSRLQKHKALAHPPPVKLNNENATDKPMRTLCTFCGKYMRKEHFNDHILRMHYDGKVSKYVCDYCGKGFLHKCDVRDHMFRHIKHKTFKCDECDFWTISQSAVNAHKKIKHMEVVFRACTYPECNYSCRFLAQLQLHVTTNHLGLRPFKCDECNKTFVTSTILKYHKATHTDAENFECDICQKKFRTNSRRSAHRKRAHQEGKFHCDLCTRTFHSDTLLQNHINQIHDKIRKHICDLCEKSYTTRNYLLEHIKEIHFKTKISCEICGTKLARMTNYKMHVKAKHKDLGDVRLAALYKRMKSLKADFEKMMYYYDD